MEGPGDEGSNPSTSTKGFMFEPTPIRTRSAGSEANSSDLASSVVAPLRASVLKS